VSAASEVTGIKFYLREPNSGDGTPIGYEDLPADFDGTSGKWEYELDTNQVSDGNYVILAKATDECNNIGFSELVPVTVSHKLVVPNIVGATEAAANTAIVDANLVVGTITADYNDTVAAGLVISQDPNAGTVVATGSSVNYVKSLGYDVVGTWSGNWTYNDSNGGLTITLDVNGTTVTGGSLDVVITAYIDSNTPTVTIPVTGTYSFNATTNAINFNFTSKNYDLSYLGDDGYIVAITTTGSGTLTSFNEANGSYSTTIQYWYYYNGQWYFWGGETDVGTWAMSKI
jgi:hypothetical protein